MPTSSGNRSTALWARILSDGDLVPSAHRLSEAPICLESSATDGSCPPDSRLRRFRMPEAAGEAQLYINGDYRDGSARRQDVTSPVTGQLIGSVPVPGQPDIDAAVGAARAAGQSWARVNVWERAAICHAIGDGISA